MRNGEEWTWIDRLIEKLEDQRRVMEDCNMTRGINWERMFENTGALVNTGEIRNSIDANTAETARLADAVEDVAALLTVGHDDRMETLFARREARRP